MQRINQVMQQSEITKRNIFSYLFKKSHLQRSKINVLKFLYV